MERGNIRMCYTKTSQTRVTKTHKKKESKTENCRKEKDVNIKN
jgi:hypothetical protein